MATPVSRGLSPSSTRRSNRFTSVGMMSRFSLRLPGGWAWEFPGRPWKITTMTGCPPRASLLPSLRVRTLLPNLRSTNATRRVNSAFRRRQRSWNSIPVCLSSTVMTPCRFIKSRPRPLRNSLSSSSAAAKAWSTCIRQAGRYPCCVSAAPTPP